MLTEVLTIIGSIIASLIGLFTLLAILRKSIRKDNKEEFEKLSNNLDERFIQADEKIEEVSAVINKNEIDRIQHIILNFTEKLRQGVIPTIIQFKNIYELYSKYKKLGGNHYIDQEKQIVDKYYDDIHGSLHSK